ncbi:hypothetical protein HK098_002880 [Nowakowskiella sp. JEL0407]|nr:hypothetical protein HK098_002880 [Nowakowskiella sp. JEL0407]
MDGTWWQHHPRTSALSDFLYPPTGDAQIGKIRSVISTFTFSDPNMSASNIRAQPSVEPLGCVGDIGWYAIRFSLFAYNYKLPESVVGVITGRHPETGAITQFSGIMVYADNQSATFDCGFNAALNQRSEISAEKGTVRIPDTFMPFGGRKEDGLDSKTRFYYAMDGAGNGHREVWEEVVQDVEIGVQEYMIKDFHACIEGKLDWKVFAKQTQAIHAIMDAALQSANNGSVPVKL